MKTKTMNVIDNKLYMGSFMLEEVAKKYGTPLYVYDEVHIKDKIDKYKKSFISNKLNCQVVYASKAFICPHLCNILKERNIFIDAISIGDLYLLKKSNYPMSMVVLHGNNKSIEELTFSSNNKVPEEAVQSYDLSEKQNKSVMAWYTDKDKNGLYEMTIGQDKGVVANSNSAYLCCDVGQVDGIENLYTTGVKDMSYMFFQYRADAPFEKAVLDLGDNFDTSAVENMDGMFWYTSHIFSAITLRLGKAFQFDNVKSSVLAFQLGESSNNKILVSKLEQKNFIIAPEHNCVVDEAGFEKYIIVE